MNLPENARARPLQPRSRLFHSARQSSDHQLDRIGAQGDQEGTDRHGEQGNSQEHRRSERWIRGQPSQVDDDCCTRDRCTQPVEPESHQTAPKLVPAPTLFFQAAHQLWPKMGRERRPSGPSKSRDELVMGRPFGTARGTGLHVASRLVAWAVHQPDDAVGP